MCPVLAECRRDTLGEIHGVWGGLNPLDRQKERTRLKQVVRTWPESRRLEWGKELHRLREAGEAWRDIQQVSGMPMNPGEALIAEWQRHKPDRAEVVDLPLPEPEPEAARRPPFPGRPGRRHAWARHNGLVSDAWYRGQTPDGAWINVTTEAGRGQSHKWLRKEDVHLYRPQAVIVLNFPGRPDTDERDHDLTA